MAEQEQEKVKQQRANVKRWVTRSIAKLNKILLVDSTKEQIEQCLQEVSIRSTTLSNVQEKFETFLEPSNIDQDFDEAGGYIDAINEVTADDRQRLSRLVPVPHVKDQFRPKQEIHPLLPKIEIPKFSGNFSEWPPFFDKFSALIDQTTLPTISKVSYLQSLLVGDAKKCIEGLSLTENNYRVAMELLADRFGRKERIVFGHIQDLLDVEFRPTGSVQSLWNTFSRIQINVRSLESLGVDGTQYGVVLTPLIVSRLPQDLRLMWARESHHKEADLIFLMTFIRTEIEASKGPCGQQLNLNV